MAGYGVSGVDPAGFFLRGTRTTIATIAATTIAPSPTHHAQDDEPDRSTFCGEGGSIIERAAATMSTVVDSLSGA